jgi:hypothetical protein
MSGNSCPINYIPAPPGTNTTARNIYFPGADKPGTPETGASGSGRVTGGSKNIAVTEENKVTVGDKICIGPSNASFKFTNGKYAVDTSKQIVCPMGTPLKSDSGNYYCVVNLENY